MEQRPTASCEQDETFGGVGTGSLDAIDLIQLSLGHFALAHGGGAIFFQVLARTAVVVNAVDLLEVAWCEGAVCPEPVPGDETGRSIEARA